MPIPVHHNSLSKIAPLIQNPLKIQNGTKNDGLGKSKVKSNQSYNNWSRNFQTELRRIATSTQTIDRVKLFALGLVGATPFLALATTLFKSHFKHIQASNFTLSEDPKTEVSSFTEKAKTSSFPQGTSHSGDKLEVQSYKPLYAIGVVAVITSVLIAISILWKNRTGASSTASDLIISVNQETAVQDAKVTQGFDLESFLVGGDHSQKVKVAPTGSGDDSKDCVNLSSSTAVSRLNEETSNFGSVFNEGDQLTNVRDRVKKEQDEIEGNSSSSNIQGNDKEVFTDNDFFTIEGNPAPGYDKKIVIQIAYVFHLSLNEKSLGEIFKAANTYTLNVPYAIYSSANEIMHYSSKKVYRYNYNGTHSARVARYLEILFNIINKNGGYAARKILQELSTEDRLNLILAAYFLSAGRIDECLHDQLQDDDYERSAIIYETYAKQLSVKPETIKWIKDIIINFRKSKTIDKEKDEISKSKFAYDLLKISHELDLVRLYRADHLKEIMEASQKLLTPYISGRPEEINYKLFDYAKNLCSSMGCVIPSTISFPDPKKNYFRFEECSLDGAVCWWWVHKVNFYVSPQKIMESPVFSEPQTEKSPVFPLPHTEKGRVKKYVLKGKVLL